jgi:molecular chaperone DnaK (HSP70)
MSAVAEGAAIQAAIKSQLVPTYELQSALMLDTLPHAIGIAVATNSGDDGMDENQNLESLLQTDQQKRDHKKGFVEILPKDAPLPAFGTATFALARVDQPGFTLTAVEDVGSKFPLQKIQQFTFLLHRLRPEQLTAMERRTIEIEMRMETDGKLIVSFFDSNDPEHVQKMMKRQKQSMDAEKQPISTTVNPDVMTMDQIALVVACAVLFVLYVVVKLMFHTPEENARIV